MQEPRANPRALFDRHVLSAALAFFFCCLDWFAGPLSCGSQKEKPVECVGRSMGRRVRRVCVCRESTGLRKTREYTRQWSHLIVRIELLDIPFLDNLYHILVVELMA